MVISIDCSSETVRKMAWNVGLAGFAAGEEAAFAGDELVAVASSDGADGDWLDHSGGGDGVGQVLELGFVEAGSGFERGYGRFGRQGSQVGGRIGRTGRRLPGRLRACGGRRDSRLCLGRGACFRVLEPWFSANFYG